MAGLELVPRRGPVTLELWDSWWERDGPRLGSGATFDLQKFLARLLTELRSFVLLPANGGEFADRLDRLLARKEEAQELARGLDNVVSCDYITSMKTAGIRDLKARLSSYLREVARGDVVLVTDRGRVVAEIRPPGSPGSVISRADLRYHALVERGLVRPAAAPGAVDWSAVPRVRLRRGTSQELLEAERAE